MLHVPQRSLISLEWEIRDEIVVCNLTESNSTEDILRQNRCTYFGLLREESNEVPDLLSRPRKGLGVVHVVSECVLPQLAHTLVDDLFNSFLWVLTIPNLVYELGKS
jgi:hypothetical protein